MPDPSTATYQIDPAEMTLRGRLGAFVTHSRHDSKVTTAKARETFLSKFEREVDPDGVLPEAERQRRAEYARKAHFTRLALASAKARRAKAKSNTSAT